MSDLLLALQKERGTVMNKIHTINLFLQNKSEVVSRTPYTEMDLLKEKLRLEEVEVAISAIKELRKSEAKQ